MVENIPYGYKKTDVGVIPKDWNVKYLGECLDEKPSYGINAAAVPYTESLPSYIRITDISEDGKFIKKNRTSVICDDATKYQLKENDIVFTRTGASTGKSYLYNLDDGILVFAGFLIRTRINLECAIPRYIKACVETSRFWDWIKMMSIRSGQPGINGNEYASFFIPLPPLPEQKIIASALSDIDCLINSLTKLISKNKNLKLGAMQELLVGKKRLDEFSGDCIEMELGDIVDIRNGQLITAATVENGNVPVIAGGKQPAYFHKYSNRNRNTITISASGASAGYVSIHTIPIFASDCSTIDDSDKYSVLFIYYQLLLKQNDIYKAQSGGAQPHIHASDLKSLIIICPPTIEEQIAIAQVLYDMDTELEKLNQKLSKYKNIKKGMMEELLTGKRRLI